MFMQWPLIQFGRLYAEPSRNGIYKSKGDQGTGVKIVNMGEMFAYDVIGTQDMKRVRMNAAEMDRAGLANGDLLFGRRSLVEAGAGKCCLVENLSEPTTFESSIIRVRVKQSIVRPRFLFYWFRSHQGAGRVRAIVTGTNVKGIRGSVLKNIDVACPPVNIQDAIVSVVRTYDDLIANNRRRIQLLEEAARLLYREWFVHLRFPGHEHAKIKDGIPEGWKRGPLGQLCVEVREICQPASLEPDAPYIGLEHMPRRSIALSEWGTTEQVTSSKHRFRENDILFGKIRPYFHKVGIALTEGIASSDAIVIRPASQELLPLVLMVTSSDAFVADTAQKMKEGSKMPRADWKQMTQYPVLYPSDNTLWALNDFIEPILQQIKTLVFSNRNLAVARDLLLPKLMSGEVAV